MNTIVIEHGTRSVVTSYEPETGVYSSRLYVNGGDTATLQNAKHKSQRGMLKWASKVLECEQCIHCGFPALGYGRCAACGHADFA